MKLKNPVIAVLLLAVAGVFWLFEQQQAKPDSAADAVTSQTSLGDEQLARAFDLRLNDEWVHAKARVTRLLTDDNEGSRHQRFIIETSQGQSILIAHNIDLAPRVPVAIGDRIEFKGVYEWNERGGVVHWTHHDPQKRGEEGYILHQRKRYE
ncbi:MAG: DUF3465 domain-containing protein [Pseudomonadota bacterium]